MLTKHYIHQLNAAFSRDIRQSNDPTMKDVVHVDKSRKIRIYGYQNTCFLRRLFKEFSVARIGTQCARFKDVMAFTSQPFRQFSTCASINEEFHLISVSCLGKT
jgi:hypothetical protein